MGEGGENMNKKQKKMLTRIIIAFVLIVVLSLLPVDGSAKPCGRKQSQYL